MKRENLAQLLCKRRTALQAGTALAEREPWWRLDKLPCERGPVLSARSEAGPITRL